METVVRVDGMLEAIVESLLSKGYYKTKAEVIRAGILELGKEYEVIGDIDDELALKKMQKIEKEIDSGKRKLKTLDEIEKKYR